MLSLKHEHFVRKTKGRASRMRDAANPDGETIPLARGDRARQSIAKAGERARPADPWWRHGVFYQILVDRFRRGDDREPTGDPARPEFCGGDLHGVRQRLDYLRALGVTVLWLSPIQCTAAYHGYHVTSFEEIEPRFGGMNAFEKLLRAAKPDLRIILDWVPNHVHRTHPFFQAAQRHRHSRYRDWFYFDRAGRHRCFLDVDELPKLNLDHPEARRYVIDCALRWLACGVDGFRLDHVLGPSLGFWREFCSTVKRRFPSAFLVGEAWFMGIERHLLPTLGLPRKHAHERASREGLSVIAAVMREYADVFDGVLDFEFQRIVKEEVAHPRPRPRLQHVQSLLDAHYARFPQACCLPSFLDNHDMNRFLHEAGDRPARLRQAAQIQFQQPHPPVLYYGTEVGLSQTRPIRGPHGDLQARALMNWHQPDRDLWKFYAELIRAWRRSQ